MTAEGLSLKTEEGVKKSSCLRNNDNNKNNYELFLQPSSVDTDLLTRRFLWEHIDIFHLC